MHSLFCRKFFSYFPSLAKGNQTALFDSSSSKGFELSESSLSGYLFTSSASFSCRGKHKYSSPTFGSGSYVPCLSRKTDVILSSGQRGEAGEHVLG